ncbi:hypothetical protein QBC41DRAFT_236655 [Cercophora samala]|uniref:Uncharacterized protein n=1 Tax=Cercophora samala TaxID=330535 RepID=A0AA39YXS3_9PEZI|nr:hypothetical protein QBC41DRAFT_236655 [Cercophora samala]
MPNNILPQASEEQDFDKVMIMPSGYMDPFYRHEYDGSNYPLQAWRKQGFGFKDTTLVALPGLPLFNIPTTQFSYESSVSGLTEYLPGNIALVGPRGYEVALVQLVKGFLASSKDLHGSVATGSVPFPG